MTGGQRTQVLLKHLRIFINTPCRCMCKGNAVGMQMMQECATANIHYANKHTMYTGLWEIWESSKCAKGSSAWAWSEQEGLYGTQFRHLSRILNAPFVVLLVTQYLTLIYAFQIKQNLIFKIFSPPQEWGEGWLKHLSNISPKWPGQRPDSVLLILQ